MDEVTGLLRDVELEIKEQYVADLESQLASERKALMGPEAASLDGSGIYLTQVPSLEELKEAPTSYEARSLEVGRADQSQEEKRLL